MKSKYALRVFVAVFFIIQATAYPGQGYAKDGCDPDIPKIVSELNYFSQHPIRYVFNFKRVRTLFSILKISIQDLLQRNRIDALTNVYNKSAYYHDLADFVRENTRYKRGYAMLVIDIDHFKRVNDTYGHQAGDVALSYFAGILDSQLRSGDRVYRYGGEEFVVLLKEASHQGVMSYINRIAMTLSRTSLDATDNETWNIIESNSGKIKLQFSAGVVLVNPTPQHTHLIEPYTQGAGWHPPKDPDPLFAAADQQLYHVKQELGRGHIAIATWGETPENSPWSQRLFD